MKLQITGESKVSIRTVLGCGALRRSARAGRCRGCGGCGGRGGRAAAVLLLASVALLGERLGAAAALDGARCPPCPPHAPACEQLEPTLDECLYKVDNITETLRIVVESIYFRLACPEGGALNSTSLPRFTAPQIFPQVSVAQCALGGEPLARALERLNVRVADTLLLTAPPGELRADHFHHLNTLRKLVVQKTVSTLTLGVAEKNVTLFNCLANLTDVTLIDVQLPLGITAFQNLTQLTSLKLIRCFLKKIERSQLCKLPLKTLYISDASLSSILNPEVRCNMSEVTLLTSRLRSLPTFHAAKSLVLRLRRMQKLRVCSSLENLTLIYEGKQPLEAGWVAACGALRRLTLQLPNLAGALSAELLAGATDLQHFKLTVSTQVNLSSDLFANTRNIRVLVLTNNKFKELPRGVFSWLARLEELDLAGNELGGGALLELSGRASLRRLVLSHNPLGDLCYNQNNQYLFRKQSPLSSLSGLRELSLARTGAARICPDWRDHLTELRLLDLENNLITELQWEDLQDWNQEVEVRLSGNNLSHIRMNRNDYGQPVYRPDINVRFIIGAEQPLNCDCNMYWFAKAMREHLVPANFEQLYCSDEGSVKPLVDFDLNRMVCRRTSGCPSGCTCIWRPKDETILMDCMNSSIGILPNVTGIEGELSDSEIMLRVNNRNISVLPATLPARLSRLDVRNNLLSLSEEREVQALLAGGRRVWLAHNLLHCACAAPLLRELRTLTKQNQVVDLDKALCADRRRLKDAVWEMCSAGGGGAVGAGGAGGAVWLAGGAGAALLLAGAAALVLRREVRLRLKAFLLARGLCLRWVQPHDDDDCKYDAFLSYAHEDAGVAAALLAELERGPRALRLCVHHRDWQPGEWIPKQIAQSVKDSRRTIILVSENFAKSSWARAEFREAYAHALRDNAVRLIVVVLGDAPPAGLDPEIQHYVTNNTYVRWGEPAFWEKLRLALPLGRLRPPPLHTERKGTKHSTAPAPGPPPPRRAARAPRNPRPPTRPSPLRTDPPFQSADPQPPTPVVKFAHIDFPTPVKPGKNTAPACA